MRAAQRGDRAGPGGHRLGSGAVIVLARAVIG